MNDGYQNIVLRGQGTVMSLLPGGMLLFFAAAFFVPSVRRFKFE